MKRLIFAALISTVVLAGSGAAALAQVPVIDNANLTQATQTATNTRSIMQSSQQIRDLTQNVLTAVTGDRSSAAQQFSQSALGSGFNISQAPNLGSILSTGTLSWGGLNGNAAQAATTLINGLSLVQSMSGLINGASTTQDKSYQTAVSTVTALAGLISATQGASQTRQQAFSSASGQIGQATDLKASIDQNSQLVVQGSQTMNEMIGAINSVLTAQNIRNTQAIALQSSTAAAMAFDGSKVTFQAQ
jgi:hypothetical protein